MQKTLKFLALYLICNGIFIAPLLIIAENPIDWIKFRETLVTFSFMWIPAYGIAVLFSKKGKPTSLKLIGVLWIIFNFITLQRMAGI